MDTPETHVPHKPHTGHRWLDVSLGLAALLVSAISLYVAVHHGEIMEKLVKANSFPHAQVDAAVTEGAEPGSMSLSLSVANTGVGPARIETIEVWQGDRPLASAESLIEALKATSGVRTLSARLEGETVLGTLVGAGKEVRMLALVFPDTKLAQSVLITAAGLESRVCYCSVFDECHVRDTRVPGGRPKHVDRCPKPAAPYDDDLTRLVSRAAFPAPAAGALAP